MRRHSGDTIKKADYKDWWLYNHMAGTSTSDLFPDPVCKYSEINFLIYLICILQNLSRTQKFKTTQDLTLYNYGLTKFTTAKGIQKRRLVIKPQGLLGIFKEKRIYTFGPDTFLITTGPLAGTVAEKMSHFNLPQVWPNIREGLTYVVAQRPLYGHADVLERIATKIGHENLHKSSEYIVELLLEAQRLIIKYGYIHALLYCLEMAAIDHDKDSILKNSELAQIKVADIKHNRSLLASNLPNL